MTVELLVTALIGNIPAIIILYWVMQERAERIVDRANQDRFLKALLGYKTDPDTSDVIRIEDSEEAPQRKAVK